MPDPINYNIANPTDAFKSAYAFGSALSQQDAAQTRAQKVNDAIKSVATDRSPENIAKVLLEFPELKEQVSLSESVLGDAERTAANGLRAEVISLYKSGNRDAARARLETQANAYANTPGKEKEAKAAQTMLQAFDKNPDAVILPMSIQLAQSDEKLYKNLFDNTEKTAFQKNLLAAGIDPQSPRGVALSEQYAVNQADPWIETEVINPSGQRVMFKGPQSVYMQNYGPKTAPSQNNAPKVGEVRAGYRYAGGDPANSKNWIKVEGGQTNAPASSGGFR